MGRGGASGVGHKGVISAVTTALLDLFSRQEQLPGLPDAQRIDGKVCLITGANSGLGRAVAIDLARRGGHIIMACRSGIPAAGEEVKRASGNPNVEMLAVDLSDLRSVTRLCDQMQARNIKLDIAVMNAGNVEQIGTPTEIYDRPATVFVASFIGQANLWSGRQTGRHNRDFVEVDVLVPPVGPQQVDGLVRSHTDKHVVALHTSERRDSVFDSALMRAGVSM